MGIFSFRTAFLAKCFEIQMREFQLRIAENAEFEDKMRKNVGHNYCITHKGYVAWAPKEAREEDQICLLEGSRLPFVLRLKNGEKVGYMPSYELLGDCYLHGMMRGPGIYGLGGEKRRIRIV